MPPTCRACGHPLEHSNLLEMAPDLTRCPSCHAVEPLSPGARPPGGAESLNGQKLKHRHGSLQVHERGDVLEVRWTWSLPQTLVGLGIGCVFLGGPTLGLLNDDSPSGRYGSVESLVPSLLGLLLPTAFALFLYWMVSRLVNRTTVRVGPQGLHTTYGPLPGFGGVHLPREALGRFHVVWRDDDYTLYELAALGTDGVNHRLLVFNDKEPALRLARALNAWLGIPEHARPQPESEAPTEAGQAPSRERPRQV